MSVPNPDDIVSAFVGELALLWRYWSVFAATSMRDPGDAKLMNGVAANIFGTFQDALKRSIVAITSRLLDPATTAGRENLSLFRLVADLPIPATDSRRQQITAELDRLVADAAPIRAARNKWIAHADLRAGLRLDPIPFATVADAERIIKGIWKVFDMVRVVRGEGPTFIDWDTGSIEVEATKLREALGAHVEADRIRRGLL